MIGEFQEMNRKINNTKMDVREQNKKIHEITKKLDDTENKTELAKSYLSGFSSIFGFFPKLFKSNNKKDTKEEKEKIKSDKHNEPTTDINDNNKYYDEYDELEKEINHLNKNAQDVKNELLKSKQATELINKKIEKNSVKIENIKKEAERIKNNY